MSEEAEQAQLGLGPSELVLEGFRRVDEWHHMEDTVKFDEVLIVDLVSLGTLDEESLKHEERSILDNVDGIRDTREVIRESTLNSFDAIKIIYQFIHDRVGAIGEYLVDHCHLTRHGRTMIGNENLTGTATRDRTNHRHDEKQGAKMPERLRML